MTAQTTAPSPTRQQVVEAILEQWELPAGARVDGYAHLIAVHGDRAYAVVYDGPGSCDVTEDVYEQLWAEAVRVGAGKLRVASRFNLFWTDDVEWEQFPLQVMRALTPDPTPVPEAGAPAPTEKVALVERIARALWDHDTAEGTTAAWRDMAWADMGGSEPSDERADYELRAGAVVEALPELAVAPAKPFQVLCWNCTGTGCHYGDGSVCDRCDGTGAMWVTTHPDPTRR